MVTAVELGLICLLAPALTADLISGERERQTLDLLLVTPLSRRQIVIGKLVAALGSLLLLIVLALPIQALAVLIGGIGLEELLAACCCWPDGGDVRLRRISAGRRACGRPDQRCCCRT